MQTALTPERLRNVSLFAGLESRDLDDVAAALRLSRVRAGTHLISMEQPGNRAYVILSGTVKVFVDHIDGSEVILALLGPGEVVGEMSLVDNLSRSASVTTLETSTLAWMDRASFWRQMQSTPQLMANMVALLSRRLRLANTRLRASATLDVEGRVALQILALAHEFGEETDSGGTRIPVRLSQNDLAALVSASRVRVNQIMVDYKRNGFLEVDRNLRITVLNEDALAQRVGEDLLTLDEADDR